MEHYKNYSSHNLELAEKVRIEKDKRDLQTFENDISDAIDMYREGDVEGAVLLNMLIHRAEEQSVSLSGHQRKRNTQETIAETYILGGMPVAHVNPDSPDKWEDAKKYYTPELLQSLKYKGDFSPRIVETEHYCIVPVQQCYMEIVHQSEKEVFGTVSMSTCSLIVGKNSNGDTYIAHVGFSEKGQADSAITLMKKQGVESKDIYVVASVQPEQNHSNYSDTTQFHTPILSAQEYTEHFEIPRENILEFVWKQQQDTGLTDFNLSVFDSISQCIVTSDQILMILGEYDNKTNTISKQRFGGSLTFEPI